MVRGWAIHVSRSDPDFDTAFGDWRNIQMDETEMVMRKTTVTHVCDRCGGEVIFDGEESSPSTRNRALVEYGWHQIFAHSFGIGVRSKEEKRDLCSQCHMKFELFMNDPKAVIEKIMQLTGEMVEAFDHTVELSVSIDTLPVDPVEDVDARPPHPPHGIGRWVGQDWCDTCDKEASTIPDSRSDSQSTVG